MSQPDIQQPDLIPKKSPTLEVIRPDKMDRSKFIGGTDAAAICGQSRWKTILSVWAEKTGRVKPADIGDRLPVKLGLKMEQIVCELFTEETGKKLHRVNETIFHPQHNYLAANIDRRVVGEDAIFEAKTCSVRLSKEWQGDEIPPDYIFQCLHYLMVTGKQRCYLAVLIGNEDFKIKVIDRDEKLLTSLFQREILFWKDYVEADLMPLVVSYKDGDLISQLYPVGDENKEIVLGDDANMLIENLKAYEADYRNIEHLIDQKKNELKLMMGEAVRATTGINQIKWVNSQTSRLDGKALLEAHPDIHKQFYRSTPTRRFTYGPVKQEAEHGEIK